MTENQIGAVIVDSAIRIHQALSPGLLESVYETVLEHDLTKRGLTVQRQVAIPITFEGHHFDEGFRADLVVNNSVIIELKSVEKIHPSHMKQVLTYLKLTGMRLGFLLNFREALMKTGIVRVVNGLPDEPKKETLCHG